jgi:hypothetical protein
MAGATRERAEFSTLDYVIHVRTDLVRRGKGLRGPSPHLARVHTIRLRRDKTETRTRDAGACM